MNATLILSIGETVEEVTDSGFLGTTPTLACSQLGDDALIQVDENASINEHAFKCTYMYMYSKNQIYCTLHTHWFIL